MIITNKLKLDLQMPGILPTIHAVQNDSYSRNLEIALFSDRKPFVFPNEMAVVIRYKKSDGKGGEYDTLPDGTSAWRTQHNVLTVALAPQVLVTPGSVHLSVTLIADGTQLSVFPIHLAVAPIAAGKLAKSEDYFYITGLLPAPASGNVGQSLRIAAVNSEGRITAVEAADSNFSDALVDPAAYGLPVLYLTGDTTGMSKDNAVPLDYVYGERSGTATVKWQGSSSLSYPKKNYTIQFDNAFEAAAGWGEQKKYCLKANYIDFSHARNVVSAKLWGEIVKSRKQSGGVTGMIGTNNLDRSNFLYIEDGVINVRTTVYQTGLIFFTGNTYPAGEHTITFELYNPYTAETDTSFAVFTYGVPGTEGTDYNTVNVNSKEKYGEWLSRSVTVNFPVDGSMIGLVPYSPQGDPTGQNGGYSIRNIKVDGETYSIEPTNSVLKTLINGGAIDGFPVCVCLNGQYTGLYTFNIPKDGWMFGMGEGEKEAIVCADNASGDPCGFKSATATFDDFSLEYAPDENNTDWILESLNTLISAVMNSDGTDLDSTVAEYLDWQSAIDYMIFTVMLKGTDMFRKNYLLATYDGVKWFFSAYDMDNTYGITWTGKAFTSAIGYPLLNDYNHRVMELIYAYKKDELLARYEELRNSALAEDNLYQKFTNYAAGIPAPVLIEDAKLWPQIPSTLASNTAQILGWYRMRCAFIDKMADNMRST